MLRRVLVGLGLVSVADAVYLALTRPMIGVDAFGVEALVLLAAVESLALVPAFVAASSGWPTGARRAALLAALAALGLALLLPPRSLALALLGGALYSFATATLYNLALAEVLEDRERAVRRYAAVSAAMNVGWSLGSTVAWPLFYAAGYAGAGAAVALLTAAAAAAVARGEGRGDSGVLEALRHPLRSLGPLLPLAAASSALHTVGMSAYGVELDRALARLAGSCRSGRLLYGALRGGLPTLVEAALRLRLPGLVERLGSARLLLASLWLSALLYSSLPLLPAPHVVAAWFGVVAAFAAYDVALYSLLAEVAEGPEAAAVGALSLASGAGNLAVALFGGAAGLGAAHYLSVTALTAAAASLALAPSLAPREAASGEVGVSGEVGEAEALVAAVVEAEPAR